MGDSVTHDAAAGDPAADVGPVGEPLAASTIVAIGAVAVLAQLLFVGLAWWRPTTTWHLAPVLAAAAPGVVARTMARRPFDLAASSASSLAVAALGELVVLGLWETELLRGPTLLGAESGVEHLAGVVLGALIGWRMMTRPDRLGGSS